MARYTGPRTKVSRRARQLLDENKAKYYDRKGRLSRLMVFTDLKMFGKRRIPARMELIPYSRTGKPEKGRKTVMVYKAIEFDANVPESTFSLSRLERNR